MEGELTFAVTGVRQQMKSRKWKQWGNKALAARVLFSIVSYNQGVFAGVDWRYLLLREIKRTILLPEHPLLTTRNPPAVSDNTSKDP
jgi:hypothetical protein